MIRLLVKVTLRYSKTVCFHRRVAEIAEVSAPLGQFVAEGLRSYGESASLPVRTLPGTFGRLSMQRYPPV